MSDEHQLDDSDFGIRGIEKSQGYSEMPLANPAPSTDDLPTDSIMDEEQLAHAKRPIESDWGELTEREYRDVNTGKEIPANQTVPAEQAASDLARARAEERQAREAQGNRDLAEALDTLQARDQGQQPAQDQQQPELDGVQPEYQVDPAEAAARAEADAAWQAADQKITEMLQDPVIRERIQGEYDQIKQTAAAEASAQVERAHNLSAAAQQHYQQATTNLLNEAGGIIGALVPELNGLSGPQLQGALQVMAQTNPQRLQALQHLASRAQGLVEAQARQAHEAAQGQALQREAALEQYTSANVKEYENWSARDNPETLKSIRENLKPTVEKYGVPFETLMAIHNGKLQVDATTFVRSAAFQKMLHNSIKYELASRGVTEARSNPVPRVQRPGVAERTADPGEIAAASMAFNRPGGNIGTDGLRNAAALITAKRAGR